MPGWLEGLIADGTIALVAAGLLVAMTVVLMLRFPRARLGLLANAVAGVALMMALREALDGARPTWVAAWLGAAFVAYLADLAIRLRA